MNCIQVIIWFVPHDSPSNTRMIPPKTPPNYLDQNPTRKDKFWRRIRCFFGFHVFRRNEIGDEYCQYCQKHGPIWGG